MICRTILAVYLIFEAACCLAQSRPKSDDATVSIPHILRVVEVTDANSEAFEKELREIWLPVWKQLNADGILEELKVLKITETIEEWVDTPEWSHLLLARISPIHTGIEYLSHEQKLLGKTDPWKSSAGRILRAEVLDTVPGSYFPWPHPDFPDREDTVYYLVEYADIRPQKGFTLEYEALMENYFGPGAGLLYREGKRFGFVALGTSSVIFSHSTMPEWDQVHISATYSDEWDYLFFDAVSRANPSFEKMPTVKRVLELRSKWREDWARELTEYRVRMSAETLRDAE